MNVDLSELRKRSSELGIELVSINKAAFKELKDTDAMTAVIFFMCNKVAELQMVIDDTRAQMEKIILTSDQMLAYGSSQN